jgi:hypothetical protein
MKKLQKLVVINSAREKETYSKMFIRRQEEQTVTEFVDSEMAKQKKSKSLCE